MKIRITFYKHNSFIFPLPSPHLTDQHIKRSSHSHRNSHSAALYLQHSWFTSCSLATIQVLEIKIVNPSTGAGEALLPSTMFNEKPSHEALFPSNTIHPSTPFNQHQEIRDMLTRSYHICRNSNCFRPHLKSFTLFSSSMIKLII